MILGDLVPLCEAFQRTLRRIKDAQGLTNQQIADKTGVPVASVQRFFSGATANPGLYNVIAVCKCLGASIDAAFGLGVSESDTDAAVELRHEQEKARLLADELRVSRRMGAVLSAALLLCILVLLVYVLHFDIGNPDFGFFTKG